MMRCTMIGLFLLSTVPSMGQIGSPSSMTDRYGTFYTFSAVPLQFNNFYMYQNYRVWKGDADRFDGGTSTSVSIKDFSAVWGFQYGVFNGFDVGVVTNMYQTPNRAPSIPPSAIVSFFKTKDIPSSFTIHFRMAPWAVMKNKLRMGVMVSTRWETGPFANVPFQSYATDKTTVGIAWLMTYMHHAGSPETGLTIHGNLQYVNHLDKGQFVGFFDEQTMRTNGQGAIADQAVATGNTSALRFALGAAYPLNLGGTTMFVTGDVYGNAFLTKPPAAAYTRQNSAYGALGIKYQFFRTFAIHLGGEYQIVKGTTPSFSSTALGVEDLTISKSDFPTWRVFGGFSVTPSPKAQFIKTQKQIAIETAKDPEDVRKKEVENVLYSEQEVQKRRVNFTPVENMRSEYKTSIQSLIDVLAPHDKKPIEPVDAGGE